MTHDITWITSFSQVYFDSVAKYNLPGWSMLEGHKIAMTENMPGFSYPGLEVIDATPAYPDPNDPHFALGGTKKGKFWRKGKCFLWAIRNAKTRWVIWLDSDVKVLNPIDLNRFWPREGDVVSLICGNLKQAESGFVIVDTHHPLFRQWTDEYEQCWYNGIVDTLHRPWDNDVLWYVCKKLPHRNLSKSVTKSPQGFEDTDLLDYMYHYSGKRQKESMKPQLLASKKRSQAYQEFFAFSIGGPNKTYIEIGAFKPATKSNTYALEVDQGWRGFSMELNQKYKGHWEQCLERHNPVCWENAITFDYLAQIEKMNLSRRITFLSCDIEPPSNTFAALKRVIEQGIEFDCICFEHDKANPSNKDTTDYDPIVREYLAGKGYRVAVSDVYCNNQKDYLFETWFVKNDVDYPPTQTFDEWKIWMGLV